MERSSSERSGIAREVSPLLTLVTRLPANVGQPGWPTDNRGQRGTHVPTEKERNERWSWFNEVRAERAAACLRVAFPVLVSFPLCSRPENRALSRFSTHSRKLIPWNLGEFNLQFIFSCNKKKIQIILRKILRSFFSPSIFSRTRKHHLLFPL